MSRVGAEKDDRGREHLKEQEWTPMSMADGKPVSIRSTKRSGVVNEYIEHVFTTLYGDLSPEDRLVRIPRKVLRQSHPWLTDACPQDSISVVRLNFILHSGSVLAASIDQGG